MSTSDYTPTVATVDISDWSAGERADVHAEYRVSGAPYGENMPESWFDTREAAIDYAARTVALVHGAEYGTSWGTAIADHESIRVTRYVVLVTDPETGSVVEGEYPVPAPAPRGEDGEIDPLVFPSPYTAPRAARVVSPRDGAAPAHAFADILYAWINDAVYAGEWERALMPETVYAAPYARTSA